MTTDINSIKESLTSVDVDFVRASPDDVESTVEKLTWAKWSVFLWVATIYRFSTPSLSIRRRQSSEKRRRA